ncbi:hypothetical protein GE061_006936 [Apolygus lucorum]|uniref:Uncharacterized protein n=1 Tax=Apolygus lucorum TaxID=248454 RepID=A0A8S9WQI7_APOLU|nr:hypothetical protein GE061_006936 [Apolygus lucorum]
MEDVTGMLAEWGLSAATIEIFRADEHDRLQLLLILLSFAIPAAGKRSKPETLRKRQVVSKRDSQTSFIAFFETPEQKGAHHQELILANSGQYHCSALYCCFG